MGLGAIFSHLRQPRRGATALTALALAAFTGCATWRPSTEADLAAALPDKYTVNLDQLVVHSNFALPSQHRLLQEINAERLDVASTLALPVSDEKINVYLFKDAEQFTTFIRAKYPSFPDRRAFFVETDTQLLIFAQWGDRMAEDLRHEVSHGYMHSVVSNLPLWLDEGLAEYFEVPRGTHGVNEPHVKQLNELAKAGKWRPNIGRLESMHSPAEMTELEYAESWAWVHWLLETDATRRTLLQNYVADLHRTGAPARLSQSIAKLPGNPEQEVFEHVRELGNEK